MQLNKLQTLCHPAASRGAGCQLASSWGWGACRGIIASQASPEWQERGIESCLTMIIPIRIFLFNEYRRLSPGTQFPLLLLLHLLLLQLHLPLLHLLICLHTPLRANEINAWTAFSSYPNMNNLWHCPHMWMQIQIQLTVTATATATDTKILHVS